jgi:hypothetical protein
VGESAPTTRGGSLVEDIEKSFFLPGKVLSRFFRKRFLIHLRRAFRKGKLPFHGELESLAQPAAFEALCQKVGRMEWVVYAKRPFGGPEQVLKYLARYTHRVAISNRRLLSMQDGRVTFEWRDYAAGNRTKTMTLEAVEFIRRFLFHVLPSGFVHIRHFGFLANRKRKEKLALCRSFLSVPQVVSEASPNSPDSRDSTSEERLRRCPVCKTGRLILMQILTAAACGLIRARARRHFTIAVSAPSTNLPNSSALVRVTGNPCFEPTFWLSSNAGSGCQTREVNLPSGTVTISASGLSRHHALAPAPVKQTAIQSP